jgi:uncharacterized protein with GYD domain
MLFCINAEYTAAALTALRSNPSVNRREAAAQLIEAAGGRIIDMYGTVANGPGALLIFDVPDPQNATAICGIIKSSGSVENIHLHRLYTMDEIIQVRTKAAAIAGSYKPAG